MTNEVKPQLEGLSFEYEKTGRNRLLRFSITGRQAVMVFGAIFVIAVVLAPVLRLLQNL
ncbi:MAG: hypothetical protein H8D23_25600 [Candidatus Brocadiales bacterium]|nr:hypothetical protein [Candidatus Brocadiales bacterium]